MNAVKFLMLFAFAGLGLAQINSSVRVVESTPTGACKANERLRILASDGHMYVCSAGTWADITPSGSAAAWGSITGTLSGQTDLQTALDGKAATSIPVLTTTSVAGLSAEANLGALADNNIVAVDVSAGTATPRAALYSDVVALWAGCTGYLKNNGTCDTGGGTPGGSPTQIQFHDTGGVFAGDAGLAFDKTNKIVTAARTNASGMGGIFRATNGASLNVNAGARLEACQDSGGGADCTYLERSYGNFDGSGNGQWSRLSTQFGGVYQLIARKGTNAEVHLGGAVNNSAGYFAVTDTGVSRFGNVATAGIGLAPIMGAPSELTAQTGDLSSQTLLASSHTAGLYRVCGFAAVTATGSGSTTAWTLSWRSPASGSDLTHDLFWDSGAAETNTFSVASANEFSVCKVIRSTGASAISVNPGNMNTATFSTAWTVERLR